MKRVLSVVLVLSILFPVLLLPAAAAEPEEYVFEYFEMPVVYVDYPFLPNDDYSVFWYDGVLPEGVYTIIPVTNAHMAQQGFKYSILGTYCIKYDSYDHDIQGHPFVTSLSATMTYPDNSVQHVNVDVSLLLFDDDVDQYTLFSLYNGGTFPFVDSVIFVSYDFGIELTSFLGSLTAGLVDLSVGNIVQVILVALGVVSAPVLCWFGYRFVKRKLLKSFKKGKI